MELKHKYFIQYMIKNGAVCLEDTLKYFKDTFNDTAELKAVIRDINREIQKQDFQIAITNCEVTNKEVVLWLNTKDDEISKHQITYTALEMEYFHVLFQGIINSEQRRLPFMNALNLTSRLTSFFSRESGLGLLNKWFQGHYFIKQDEFMFLGPRLIFEFTAYLKSHCPEQVCKLCSELVFTVKMCASCDAIFHSYCLKKYLEKQRKCPSCMTVWIDCCENSFVHTESLSVEEFESTCPSFSKKRKSS